MLRASQVSRRWHDLLSDDLTWRNLCDKHEYCGELPQIVRFSPNPSLSPSLLSSLKLPEPQQYLGTSPPGSGYSGSLGLDDVSNKVPRRQQARSYKSFFKQKYLVDAAWRRGGDSVTRNITHEAGVVTGLHVTAQHIIVALDNARIHVFDRDGNNPRMLQGHVMGVWAMIPSEDLLVTGGCDRDVRVWDLATG